jgi:hypothetical protein
MRWHEDHPNYEPLPEVRINRQTREKAVKLKKDGKEVMEKAWLPVVLEKELRDRAEVLAPNVGAKVRNGAVKDIVDHLGSKMPYTHTGSRFRHEAVRNFEVSLACFTTQEIYIPSQDTAFVYAGRYETCNSDRNKEKIKSLGGDDSVLLYFPLFSRKSGRENTTIVCRLEVRQLSKGNRKLLQRISSKDGIKMADSTIRKRDGIWYFDLTYQQEQESLGLTVDNIAELYLTPNFMKKPFEIVAARKRWDIGDALPLLAQWQSIDARRASLQERYKHTEASASRGHGRQRFFRNFRQYSRAFQRFQTLWQYRAIAEIVRFCQRFDCGTVMFREPGLQLRKSSNTWFEGNNIPYNWTGFVSKLSHKLWKVGIVLKVERISGVDWKARYKIEKTLAKPKMELLPTGDAATKYDPSLKRNRIRKIDGRTRASGE